MTASAFVGQVPPNVQLWAVGYLRAKLRALPSGHKFRSVRVTNREPSPSQGDFPDRLIVVRIDGPTRLTMASWEADLAISALAGTTDDPSEADELARLLYGFVMQAVVVEPGNPVAAITASLGPELITEDQPHARAYQTHTLVVANRG